MRWSHNCLRYFDFQVSILAHAIPTNDFEASRSIVPHTECVFRRSQTQVYLRLFVRQQVDCRTKLGAVTLGPKAQIS